MYEWTDKICSSIWNHRLSVILCPLLHLLMQFLMPGMIYKRSGRFCSSMPFPHCCILVLCLMEFLGANYPSQITEFFSPHQKGEQILAVALSFIHVSWKHSLWVVIRIIMSCLSSGGYTHKQLMYNLFQLSFNIFWLNKIHVAINWRLLCVAAIY
jgi:hypothetical protein